MTRHAIRVALGDASYDVLVGTGLLEELPALLDRCCPAPRYAVITDSHLAPTYGRRVLEALQPLAPAVLLTFPAGEWNKSRDSWSALTDQMVSLHGDRETVVLALGGGVVGDLAGFVAATYLRGIRYVQLPTSLLAMLDSSIGGKTGLDIPFGKNLVGAFHQPRAVFADVSTLATLAPAHIAAGAAEAIKHGVIADPAYFALLLERHDHIRRRDPETLLAVVRRSIEIKAAVVAADERERGRRAVLNFGHTIAHGLEAMLGYELLHGEAVAIGMLVEAELGEAIGVTQRGTASQIRAAIEAYRLPASPPAAIDAAQLLEIMRRDKKAQERTVRFALPSTIGAMARTADGRDTIPIEDDAILRALAHLT